MTKEFLVVFEAGPNNFSAFAPDIPGCYGLGDSLSLTRVRFREAAEAHLAWMAADGDALPEPETKQYDPSADPDGELEPYAVEWLPIDMPSTGRQLMATA